MLMNKPIRVRLSRAKGFRLPPNTVSVARPGKWGNPFVVCPADTERQRLIHEALTAADAVDWFRQWLETPQFATSADRLPYLSSRKARLLEALPSLRGKNLACWCALPADGEPDICHAAVLLEWANATIGG